MPHAKRIEAATLTFLLTAIEPLSVRDVCLCMVSALTSDGHVDHSRRIFEAILGMKDAPEPEELREAILQSHLFCGFPRALNALRAFKQACDKRKDPFGGEGIELRDTPLEAHEDFKERGEKLFDEFYGDNAAKVKGAVAEASPDIAEWALRYAYGEVMARGVLSGRERQLCIISALMPMDVAPQLKGHLQNAVAHGAGKDELWQLFDIVSKLFNASPEIRSAKSTFEDVIGRQAESFDPETESEMRWT